MAVSPRISNAVARAALDAIVDAIDAGAGAGYIELRTGPPPATCEDVDSGTLIATCTMSDPAFGSASDNNPDAIAVANAITDDSSADATGTVGHFRVKDSNGVVIIQGTVAESDADMIIDNANVNAGQVVQITSYSVTLPEAG